MSNKTMKTQNKLLLASFISALAYKLFAYLEIVVVTALFLNLFPAASRGNFIIVDSLIRFLVCLIIVFFVGKYFLKRKKDPRLASLFFIIFLILIQFTFHMASLIVGWTERFNINMLLMEVELIAAGLMYIWYWAGAKNVK